MLALGIRYLTGYAVATDVDNREHAEWPPHPARIFMAMAAAMFECGGDANERAALEWLEQQGPPQLHVDECYERQVVTHYVPVNDTGDPIKGGKPLTALQSAALGRDRQPRVFPRVRPHDDTVYLVWPELTTDRRVAEDLAGLCQKVTRIGHSSSMVQMWMEGAPPEPTLAPSEFGERLLRVACNGTMDYLVEIYNGIAVAEHASLQKRIGESKGKEKKQLQEELSRRFGESEPVSQRPVISTWQAYRKVAAEETPSSRSGVFDRELLVFTLEDGPVIGLESTWQLITHLHKTLLKLCEPCPEWISGHTAEGKPSELPHIALLPLPFISAPHADGHLLGVGIAVPKAVSAKDQALGLSKLLFDENGELLETWLWAGGLGKWKLRPESRPSPPLALQSSTWTRESHTWATVTPIVLDRHPKVERKKDREAWSLEVAAIVSESCERQGLPRPLAVDIDKTSWHLGAPRAVGGKSAGYPLMPVKDGQPQRQQVHAWIRFDQAIQGPLILGAGRYRGYGFCKPFERRS